MRKGGRHFSPEALRSGAGEEKSGPEEQGQEASWGATPGGSLRIRARRVPEEQDTPKERDQECP